MELLALTLGIGVAGFMLGALLARLIRPAAAFAPALVAYAAAAGFIVLGGQADGWDAVGYAAFALVIAAPLGVGLTLGGAAVWVLRRKRGKR
ncbi:MAG: hypothetical protein Kow0013_05430 [Pararhodobacter sp.]